MNALTWTMTLRAGSGWGASMSTGAAAEQSPTSCPCACWPQGTCMPCQRHCPRMPAQLPRKDIASYRSAQCKCCCHLCSPLPAIRVGLTSPFSTGASARRLHKPRRTAFMVSLLTATRMATGARAANASGRRQTIAGPLCSSLFCMVAHVHLLTAGSSKGQPQ